MKKLAFLMAAALLLSCAATVYAAESTVTYDGKAQEFIFAPGSSYSPTDLFAEFKDVMPGDSLTQKITVKNDAANNIKVKIYMRALGAHADSEDFLSQLGLRVKKSDENTMAYMFDATASETAQLTDWVCLGTLYSGGEVDLDVILDVPVSLDNTYSDKTGYLDWEFKIEEFPVEDSDPKPPQTGGDPHIIQWMAALSISGIAVIALLVLGRRNKKDPYQ